MMFVAGHGATRLNAASPIRLIASHGRNEVAKRRRLERNLRAAAVTGAFILHYQPRLGLATGRIEVNEALIRWPDRKHGLIPPNVFIPIAERSDLINLIGAWALIEACSEAKGWPSARLSVNVSARQLQSGMLPIQLAMALEQSGEAITKFFELANSINSNTSARLVANGFSTSTCLPLNKAFLAKS